MTVDRQTVRLTRKRWDAYMLPFFVVTVAIAAVTVVVTETMRSAFVPLVVLSLWAVLRFKTPKDGIESPTIRSTPGAVPMLWTTASVALLFAILLLADVYLLGHSFRAPLELYHAGLFTPPFVLLFAGGYWSECIARREKSANNRC